MFDFLESNMAPLIESIYEYIMGVYFLVIETPFLLLTVGFFVLGGAIGIFGRLLNRG